MAAQSGGALTLASLLRSKRFSQGFLKAPNAPQVSDLDAPVTLARTRLIPDDETGFDRRIRAYGAAWAKVERLKVKRVQGSTSGVAATHLITIRHDPAYTIEARDMVLYDGQVYVVRSTSGSTREMPFVMIETTHAGTMQEHDLTLVEDGEAGEAIVPIPEPENDEGAATDFPVWS